jgi:predicted DNA-binding antitoxin AbrB/MazE fold protein
MDTIHAIFENGVFRPTVPVNLPERSECDLLITSPTKNGATFQELEFSRSGLEKVYQILSERFESGHSDTAARHNEHQP